MKKILICTTFREFNENENAKMQNMFLDSLKSQTYKNFELIVTIFNEKNVENELIKSKLPFKTYTNQTSEYRFSLSEVFLNGLKSANENDIIIWTTSDIIYDKDFLQNIQKKVKKETCAISYPLTIYNDFNCYMNKSGKIFYDGIDVLMFNADIFFKNKEAMDDLNKYKFINWGMFEFFLIGLGKIYFKKNLIIAPNSIKKIENNRQINNESDHYLNASNQNNKEVFLLFTNKHNLDNNFYEWLLNFKMASFNPILKIKNYLKLQNNKNKFLRKIKKIIPKVIKNLIRNILYNK
jgi:hypothetical protein